MILNLKIIIISFFLTFHISAQNLTKQDSIRKYQFIYPSVQTTISTPNYNNGQGVHGGTARGIFIDFRLGEDGPLKNIGRKGKSLRNIIKNDAEASAQLDSAYHFHLRRKRICNILEYASYAVITGAGIVLFIGLDKKDDGSGSGLTVAGGAGVAAGFAGAIVFHKLTDKHMDNFSASVLKSIRIYNTNLLLKANK